MFDLEKIKKTLNCLGRGLNSPPNLYGPSPGDQTPIFFLGLDD
jgi:hypothetical protein